MPKCYRYKRDQTLQTNGIISHTVYISPFSNDLDPGIADQLLNSLGSELLEVIGIPVYTLAAFSVIPPTMSEHSREMLPL